MGVSRKTIMTKALYNRIYHPFIGKTFIRNIREDLDQKIEKVC